MPAPPPGKCILVVDDTRFMRELLVLHLTGAGYEVRTAEDGIQAVHAVLENPPDLVICDVEMPYMSGIEFLSALRAAPPVASIPVVILTSQEDARAAAVAAGASGFLLKPIRSDELLAVVAKHLGPVMVTSNQ